MISTTRRYFQRSPGLAGVALAKAGYEVRGGNAAAATRLMSSSEMVHLFVGDDSYEKGICFCSTKPYLLFINIRSSICLFDLDFEDLDKL